MNKYLLNPSGHALILGASGGIGSEIARSLAANGVRKLTLSYGRGRDRAEELAAELAVMGSQVHLIEVTERTDETDAQFRAQLEEAVAAQGEEINIFVDSIGISPNTPLAEQTLRTRITPNGERIPGWIEVFQVNVFGAFISTRAVLDRMLEKKVKSAAVALITSTNGTAVENSGAPYSMHYNCSKAALIQMVHDFALANKRKLVRVNGVAPGWIDTPMNHDVPDLEDEVNNRIWMGRMAHPSEVANTVTFLVGPGASFVNGQNVIVSGGYN